MSSNEKVDIELLYRLRNQYKRLDQITWTVRDAQERFPVGTSENELQLIKIYLAMSSDIEEIFQEIKNLRKQYEKDSK